MKLQDVSKRCFLLMTLTLLAACMGEKEDEELQVDDVELAGIWSGEITDDADGTHTAILIGDPRGDFHLWSRLALFVGSGEVRRASFDATAEVHRHDPGLVNGSELSLSGEVDIRKTPINDSYYIVDKDLKGAYSSAGRSGTFELSWRWVDSIGIATVGSIADRYSHDARFLVIDDSIAGAFIQITPNGILTASDGSGCSVAGTVTGSAEQSWAEWSATLTGCPANGEARGVVIQATDVGDFVGDITKCAVLVGHLAQGAAYFHACNRPR